MLGATTAPRDGAVGIDRETYGAPAGVTLGIDRSVERSSAGRVDRLRRLLPGGSEEGRGRVAWTEPAGGPRTGALVTVDLRDFDRRDYTLVLRVGWEGRPPLERRRALRID